MSLNTTNLTGSSNPNLSFHTAVNHISSRSHAWGYVTENNLGYGIGKVVRGAFDYLYQSWQQMRAQEPSAEELSTRRQVVVFRQGLRECVVQLDKALDNIRKNPKDPHALQKIKSLATDCADYLQPNENADLRAYQDQLFKSLEEKISKLAHPRIKNALRHLLPILFQEKAEKLAAQLEQLPMNTHQLSIKDAPRANTKRSVQQSGGFPASFDLTVLDGKNGFAIPGVAASGQLGLSVSTAGDLNNDGMNDLVLGAWEVSGGGEAYVLFGQTGGWPASFNLTALNGTNGFIIPGIAGGGALGHSVSAAGDINGDGKDDLLLGAYGVSSYAGEAYVVFGQAGGWPASFNLATLNGTNGFAILGIVARGDLGYSVSTAGDINGDGNDDLVLGASAIDSVGGAGAAYLLFGQESGWTASFNLTTLNGTNGFAVPGIAANDALGSSVSAAGDLNGDGMDDLVLGANGVSSGAGAAYVLFGQAGEWPASFNLGALNGTNGFAVPGIAANDALGSSVSAAGDFNGDDMDDLVLGAIDFFSGPAGTAYVLFGQAGGWPASFNLATLVGTNGFVVPGLAENDGLGVSVSTAGDLNGDGMDDLVLGANRVSSQTGEAYVLFGQASGWPASFNLAILNGTNGFTIPGIAANDVLGQSVSTAGDLNGDGMDDLVLGAPYTSSYIGEAYVIFGSNTNLLTPSPTQTSITALTPSVNPTNQAKWPASFDVTTLNGTNGFSIPGIAARSELGYSISPAGDINGDGLADLVLGALLDDSSYQGEAYVLFGQRSGWPASFNLASLNGTNGFAVPGIAANGYLGTSVSTAGDFNSDGMDDLVLGAYGVSSNAGAAYVLLGQASGWPASFNLIDLDGTNGFVIPGTASNDQLGYSVGTAGDFNGDGLDDLVLGADGFGVAYVLFGQASGWPASFNLAALNGANGFAIEANGQLGISVSTAGDINGDGLDDLVLGCSLPNFGGACVIFGQASGWPASFNIAALNGTNGFAVPGIAVNGGLGSSVSTAGDINGDSLDDLVLGAVGVSSSQGEAYVIFGQASGWPASFNLTVLNGTNGFAVPGIAANGYLGTSVSTAGDINGDGIIDLILGAANVPSPLGAFTGEAYVIFGQRSGWPASFNLTLLNGTNGFAVPGIAGSGFLGYCVSTAGDINGDGNADLMLGGIGVEASTNGGDVYVIFGMNASRISTASPSILPPSPLPIKIQASPTMTALPCPPNQIQPSPLIPSYAPIKVPVAQPSPAAIPTPLLFPSPSIKPPSPSYFAPAIPSSLTALPSPSQVIASPSYQAQIPSPAIPSLAVLPSSVVAPSPAIASPSYPSYIPSPAMPSLEAVPSQLVVPSPVIAPLSFPSPEQIPVIQPSQAANPSSLPAKVSISSSLSSVSAPSSAAFPPSTIASPEQVPSIRSPLASPLSEVGLQSNPGNSSDQTIPIAAGVTSACVVLGAVAAVILLLRAKRKACFARPTTISTVVLGPYSDQNLDQDLFISRNDLKIESEIAEGSFGTVSKGTWQRSTVAIKQLKGKLTPEAVQKLFDEVKIMAKLRSPYVVPFYGVTKEQPYQIVMQYMEGGSLRDFLKKHAKTTVSWAQRIQIGHDISEGLKYLHDRKIVHADLKSLNVLLDALQQAKLADFGLASVKSTMTDQYYQDAMQAKGSLIWMAPELFDQSRHTFATDMYSFGVVLWELSTHRLPFEEQKLGVTEMIGKIAQGKREPFPTDTPQEYQKLGEQCCVTDPAERPNATQATNIIFNLWIQAPTLAVSQNSEELVPIKSPKGKLSYLTKTLDTTTHPAKEVNYIGNEDTQFGV